MGKFWKNTFFLLAITICIVMVATGFDSEYNTRTAIGRSAPEIVFDPVNMAVKNAENKGRYVLLSLWSAEDASSRRACNEYTAWLNANPQEDKKIDLIAVNFDEEQPLFEEIVRLDSLRPETQFNVTGPTAEAIKTGYNIKDVYGSVLISPEGKIVAHNPKPSALFSLMKTRG